MIDGRAVSDPPAGGSTQMDAICLQGMRILVADDYADGREMLAFFLERQGYVTAVAEDGPTALTVAAEFLPDVAILDIGMPGLSGYAVAETLRAQRGASLTLVALTGLADPRHASRAAEAGFDKQFTKPIDISLLSAYLLELKPS
jgi:CheY-like chemotaxis protein